MSSGKLWRCNISNMAIPDMVLRNAGNSCYVNASAVGMA